MELRLERQASNWYATSTLAAATASSGTTRSGLEGPKATQSDLAPLPAMWRQSCIRESDDSKS